MSFDALVSAAAAGIALTAVGVTGAGAPAARAPQTVTRAVTQTATRAGASPSLAAAGPGAQLWVKLYDNRGNGGAGSVTVTKNGSTVFVTGYTTTASGGTDYTTVAYDAATGAQRWARNYDDGGIGSRAFSVAASPNGKAVFVTGYSFSPTAGEDYATIAYNAATGAQLWVKRYNGPGDDSAAAQVAVSPNGSTVFVTGTGLSPAAGFEYTTIAYNAVTGTQRWIARYDGVHLGGNYAHALAVSPNGKTVFVTGASIGAGNSYAYATVAYSAATGAQLWARRYDGARTGGVSRGANSVAVSASTVLVTGSSIGTNDAYDYATVAYSAVTGSQLWAERYNGPGSGGGQAN